MGANLPAASWYAAIYCSVQLTSSRLPRALEGPEDLESGGNRKAVRGDEVEIRWEGRDNGVAFDRSDGFEALVVGRHLGDRVPTGVQTLVKSLMTRGSSFGKIPHPQVIPAKRAAHAPAWQLYLSGGKLPCSPTGPVPAMEQRSASQGGAWSAPTAKAARETLMHVLTL